MSKAPARRRFSERDVIRCLVGLGNRIFCYRTGELITPESVGRLEREHLTPIALGGADEPGNCAYSLSEAHKKQTFGSKATTYGSDIHAIAKAKRLARGKKPSRRPMKSAKRAWPKRSFAKKRKP